MEKSKTQLGRDPREWCKSYEPEYCDNHDDKMRRIEAKVLKEMACYFDLDPSRIEYPKRDKYDVIGEDQRRIGKDGYCFGCEAIMRNIKYRKSIGLMDGGQNE